MSFAPVEKEVIVPLLAMESSKALMEEPGVTSITFYRGDLAKATVYIRARVKAIVDANPWLAGRLVRDKQHKNVQLVHPQTPVSDDLIERLFHPNPCKLRIGSEMPYEELSKEATSAVVKKGRKLINRPDLVTRITTSQPLPGYWEGLSCTLGQISNWATFAGDLVFDGCEQQLHLPMYATGTIPFDCAIVFRPLPGKLVVMYFPKTVGREELFSGCELGEQVSTKVFK